MSSVGDVHDAKVALAAAMVARNPRGLACLDEDVRTHPRVLAAACTRDPNLIEHVPAVHLKAVFEAMCVVKLPKAFLRARACAPLRAPCDALTPWVVEKHPLALQHASDAAKDDEALVRAAVEATPRAFPFASPRLRGDASFVLFAVRRGAELRHAATRLRSDADFARRALSATRHPVSVYSALAMKLRKDASLLQEAMAGHPRTQLYLGTTSPFEYAAPSLRAQKDVVLASLPHAPHSVYRCLHDALAADVDVVVCALKHGMSERAVPRAVFEDDALAAPIVRRTGMGLGRASRALRADRAVVLDAVRHQGLALAHAADALKQDRALVLEAVAHSWTALKYASKELRADAEVVRAAVARSGNALSYAHTAWRNDRAMVTLAAKTSPFAVRQLAEAPMRELPTVRVAMLHAWCNSRDSRDRVTKELAAVADRLDALSVEDAEECSDLVAELAAKLPAEWEDVLAMAEAFVARVHAPGGAVAHAHKRAFEEAFA